LFPRVVIFRGMDPNVRVPRSHTIGQIRRFRGVSTHHSAIRVTRSPRPILAIFSWLQSESGPGLVERTRTGLDRAQIGEAARWSPEALLTPAAWKYFVRRAESRRRGQIKRSTESQ
jgi:hypothetical protein